MKYQHKISLALSPKFVAKKWLQTNKVALSPTKNDLTKNYQNYKFLLVVFS